MKQISLLFSLLFTWITLVIFCCGSQSNIVNQNNPISFDKDSIINVLVTNNFSGFTIFDSKKGDINHDKKEDVVVILQKENKEEEFDRIEVLIIQTKNLAYEIAAQNSYIIDPTFLNGAGDAHRGITIENNVISFESLHGGRDKTTKIKSFQYDVNLKDWFYYETNISNTYFDTEKEEVITNNKVYTHKEIGKIKFSDFNLNQE